MYNNISSEKTNVNLSKNKKNRKRKGKSYGNFVYDNNFEFNHSFLMDEEIRK